MPWSNLENIRVPAFSNSTLFGALVAGGVVACFFAAFMASEESSFFEWIVNQLFRRQSMHAEQEALKGKRNQQFEKFLKERKRMNRILDGVDPEDADKAEPKDDGEAKKDR